MTLNLYHSIDLLQDVVCFIQMKRPLSWYQVSLSQMTSQKHVSSRILCTETVTMSPRSLHKQGVRFLFFLLFPIFLSILLFFLFFSNFLLFFLFFSHFTYNKQIFVRDLNILSLFKYVVYRVH